MAKPSNNQVSVTAELKAELTRVADQLGLPHPGIIIRMMWTIYGNDFLQRFTTFNSELVVSTSKHQSLHPPATGNYKGVVETTSNDDNSQAATANGEATSLLDRIRNS